MSIPHMNTAGSCMTCKHFQFAKGKTKGNRNCYYPGQIRLKNGKCACWQDMRTLKQRLLRQHPVKNLCR